MTIPQSNATLTAIKGPGFSADADLPAGDGTPKWTGGTPAYVREKVIRSTAAGRLDLFKATTLIIGGDLRPPVEIASGDTVEYSYAGAAQVRRVRDIEAHLLAGVATTVRIELEDA